MISYILRFSEQAKDDIRLHKKSGNKSVVNKITVLLEELALHPLTGTGKPEPLKHALTGCWSRRIDFVDGKGEVVVNSLVFNTNRKFDMNIDIFMPCDFNQSLNYEVKLYVCDMNRNVVCLSFLFDFPNCTTLCGRSDGASLPRSKSFNEPKINPNPTSDFITIESDATLYSPYQAVLYDQLGRQIMSHKLTQSTEILNLSTEPSGIYILKITDLIGNTISTKKVIILK